MLLGKALFPGTSTINQIEKIMCAIPHPSPEGDKIQTPDTLILLQNIHECDLIQWCLCFRYFGNQIWIWVLSDSEDVIEVRKDGLHIHVVWAAS